MAQSANLDAFEELAQVFAQVNRKLGVNPRIWQAQGWRAAEAWLEAQAEQKTGGADLFELSQRCRSEFGAPPRAWSERIAVLKPQPASGARVQAEPVVVAPEPPAPKAEPIPPHAWPTFARNPPTPEARKSEWDEDWKPRSTTPVPEPAAQRTITAPPSERVQKSRAPAGSPPKPVRSKPQSEPPRARESRERAPASVRPPPKPASDRGRKAPPSPPASVEEGTWLNWGTIFRYFFLFSAGMGLMIGVEDSPEVGLGVFVLLLVLLVTNLPIFALVWWVLRLVKRDRT